MKWNSIDGIFFDGLRRFNWLEESVYGRPMCLRGHCRRIHYVHASFGLDATATKYLSCGFVYCRWHAIPWVQCSRQRILDAFVDIIIERSTRAYDDDDPTELGLNDE